MRFEAILNCFQWFMLSFISSTGNSLKRFSFSRYIALTLLTEERVMEEKENLDTKIHGTVYHIGLHIGSLNCSGIS